MSFCVMTFLLLAAQFAPTATGELRLTVTDAAGLPLASNVELVSEINQLREQLETNSDGTLVARRLPFGTYRVAVAREGFATFAGLVEIRSELPTDYRVTLGLAPLQTELTVRPEETLLNPLQTTAVQRIGTETLQRRTTALPGRALLEMVDTQPGWLLEANGVLHPRGSEYQTQYVVDGLPLTDNRSPAFAPALDADDVHTMNVLTAGYPAEYGRKLGGIIEVVTGGQARRGFHGSATGSVGSFDSQTGGATAGFGLPRTTLSVGGGLAGTDRYLDPPVEENFTNRGTTSYLSAHVDHDLSDADRLGVIVRYGRASFDVPNELTQQEAGQQQHRQSDEATVQFSHQHIFTGRALSDVRGMARTLSAALESNAAATPIIAEQDRGLRELYLKAAMSVTNGIHEWKAGGELTFGTVRERFGYEITDPSRFDSDAAPVFAFTERRSDREQALFIQDRISRGPWTVNVGARWDHYRLIVDRHAFSPRFGIAWSYPRANLVLRGSYDRAFETPAVENLLLGSSDEVESVSDDVVRLPVPPSAGNFYEAGISKALFGAFRLDATYFHRAIENFADDDVLMNTGVGFPVAFRRASIKGAEIKFDLPRWKRLSGFASYALLHGVGLLPITGGLFIGDEADELLESVEAFPISQDQRHTIRGRASYQVTPTAWIALGAAYGSGLPVELEGDLDEALDAYGERIVSRVDFEAGRVRPNFSIDASAGMVVARTTDRSVQVQVDVRNLTDRLNVINFAGLFSGTALAPPRSVAVRVRVDF